MSRWHRIGRRLIAGLLALSVLAVFHGCNMMPGPKTYEIEAKYTGLEGKSVAVLVSMPDYASRRYPDARSIITGEVSKRIMVGVEGVEMTSATEVLRWQDENQYWATRAPSQMLEDFDVQRLVLVEIGEYRTHEPGDPHILRGVITATVNVAEAEAEDPDNFAASFNKVVMFPTQGESKIGRVGVSEAQIELQTQIFFCEETAGFFFDHEIVR